MCLCSTKKRQNCSFQADTAAEGEIQIHVGEKAVHTVRYLKNLGVYSDTPLTIERQENAIFSGCYHHFRNIGRVRQYLTWDALITSRLHNRNVLLYGISRTPMERLQRMQESTAWQDLCLYSHTTDCPHYVEEPFIIIS